MTIQKEANPQWTIESGNTIVWLGNDNILRYTYTEKAEETLADAERVMVELRAKIPEGKKHPFLVDLSNTKSITGEARAYHAGQETGYIASSVALIVTSPIAKVIGNFYLTINKPVFPVRLVTTEDEGLTWLRTFV